MIAAVFYLSSAVTRLIKGDVLLFFAIHAQTRLGRIPLSICFKPHLSHVVKQLRQMLLDLSRKTHIQLSSLSAALINNVSFSLF